MINAQQVESAERFRTWVGTTEIDTEEFELELQAANVAFRKPNDI